MDLSNSSDDLISLGRLPRSINSSMIINNSMLEVFQPTNFTRNIISMLDDNRSNPLAEEISSEEEEIKTFLEEIHKEPVSHTAKKKGKLPNKPSKV